MQRFTHPGLLGEHRFAPITAAYVLFALILGAGGADVYGRLGAAVAPISSASAMAILSAIASGMMALTAIVFSLVFVAVQVVSSSYSPRLLGAMARRAGISHALGIFTGTFVYALFAIRTIDYADSPGVNLAVVTVAFLWLLASVAALVLLAPRARGLAIGPLLVYLHRSAADAAARIYRVDRRAEPAAVNTDVTTDHVVRHRGPPHYLVGLDTERLVRLASDAGAVVTIYPAIGDAVIAGDPLIGIAGAHKVISERRLRKTLWLQRERTLDNDPAYAVRLLVDIAIRALSPAVNDPTTAVSVLDELDGILRLLADRQVEASEITDEQGVVRIVRATATWDDLVGLALTEIHQYGRESIQVQRRLATLIRDLLGIVPAHRRAALERFDRWHAASQAPLLREAASWTDPSACDRQGLGHSPPGVH